MRILVSADKNRYSGASQQTISDIIKISEGLNLKVLTVKGPLSYTLFLPYFFRKGVMVTVYPYFGRPLFNRLRFLDILTSKLMSARAKSIVVIVDLPIEQNLALNNNLEIGQEVYAAEKEFLSSFDHILVFNDAMVENISKKCGISKEKFVKFEMLDFTIAQPEEVDVDFKPPYIVVYAGRVVKEQLDDVITSLGALKETQSHIYGNGGKWTEGVGSVAYRGELSQQKLIDALSRDHHFGLIAKNKNMKAHRNYHEFGSTSKLSAYLVSGLPVLVPKDFVYICSLVEKYHIGLCYDDVSDIDELLSNLTKEEYLKLRANSYALGKLLSEGNFIGSALKKAMNG